MKHLFILLFTACTLLTYAQVPEGYPANYAKAPRFKALIYYTQHAEEAHVQFAEQATTFFKKLNYGDGFVLDITTDFSKYPYEKLKEYNVIIMLNTSPNTKAERDAFEQYMENGGGWVGFHAAAYNDKNTHYQPDRNPLHRIPLHLHPDARNPRRRTPPPGLQRLRLSFLHHPGRTSTCHA